MTPVADCAGAVAGAIAELHALREQVQRLRDRAATLDPSVRPRRQGLSRQALDQAALPDLLEALKSTDVDERVQAATEHLYQALIDAELTAVVGAAPHQRTTPAPPSATAAVHAR